MWVSLHTLARCAVTYDKKRFFIDYLTELRTAFPCPTCRAHLAVYLDAHPFDAYWCQRDAVSGDDVGMFRYAFDLHNAVNVRLSKPIMDWETAVALYYDTDAGTCSADCEDAK